MTTGPGGGAAGGAGIHRGRPAVRRRDEHRSGRRDVDGRCDHRAGAGMSAGTATTDAGADPLSGALGSGAGAATGAWAGSRDWCGSGTRGHAHGARLVRVAEEGHAQCGAQADGGDQASGQHPLADEPRLAQPGSRVGRKVVAVIDKPGRIAIRGVTGRVTERARRPCGRHGALFAVRRLGGRCIAGRFQVVHGVSRAVPCLSTGCPRRPAPALTPTRLSHAAC